MLGAVIHLRLRLDSPEYVRKNEKTRLTKTTLLVTPHYSRSQAPQQTAGERPQNEYPQCSVNDVRYVVTVIAAGQQSDVIIVVMKFFNALLFVCHGKISAVKLVKFNYKTLASTVQEYANRPEQLKSTDIT